MSILNSLKAYAGKWSVKSREHFSQEDIDSISSAIVVESDYGNSIQFVLISGVRKYIPLSCDSSLSLGEVISKDKLKSLVITTLEKEGNSDILRIDLE